MRKNRASRQSAGSSSRLRRRPARREKERTKQTLSPLILTSPRTSYRPSRVLKNKTKAAVTYAFRRSAEHRTAARLTVQKGLTVGVLAGIGGGAMGAQANMAGGLAFRKTKQVSSGSSQASSREMESVPSGESVTATESVFSVEHDAECTFDISVPKKAQYQI